MKEKIVMLVFIVVLGTIFTTVLVAVESYTTPIIERNTELKRKSSILKAFELPYTKDTVEDLFLENVTGRGTGREEYYRSKDGRIAFMFLGSGLWGPIEGVLSMDKDMKVIQRVEIMHQEETPGLGGRIAEREFLDSFIEKRFAPQLKLVAAGKGQADYEIDGITGATLSSAAFVKILNTHYELFGGIVTGE